MATKNTTEKKAPKAKKAAATTKAARHPHGRVAGAHESKAALAKAIAPSLVAADEDAGALETRLARASNKQLLRLKKVSDTVAARFGSRDKLIAAIGAAHKKTGDKDFIAKLGTYSLPQLLSLAPAPAAK
jgi:hypothetical protein